MKKKLLNRLCFTLLFVSPLVCAQEPIPLKSAFNLDEVKWVKTVGNSAIQGKAFLTLKNNKTKGCAGFGVELLPVAKYSSERILNIYGNNDQGKIIIEGTIPTFTPDPKEYHDMVIKTKCNSNNEFTFNNISAGEYYVIGFIIWDTNENGKSVKTGGAVMKKIKVAPKENIEALLNF
ncbi:MAG TPA: hypothetical protein PK002_04375 [Cellvibrio sp.]|nr:hypothetical protein [Cellvibrio sp.]